MSKRPQRNTVEVALREAGGNLTKTAGALGCSRQALYTWCYQLGLDRLAGIESKEVLRARVAARAAEAPPGPRNEPAIVPAAVRLPRELWRWARIAAIDRDTSASAIVAEALELHRAIAEGPEGPGRS